VNFVHLEAQPISVVQTVDPLLAATSADNQVFRAVHHCRELDRSVGPSDTSSTCHAYAEGRLDDAESTPGVVQYGRNRLIHPGGPDMPVGHDPIRLPQY